MISRKSEKLRNRENWLGLPKIRSLRSLQLSLPRGFTIIELLITLSIVAILLSIMMPGLKAARESANRIQCSSNLRQIGLAIYLYAFQNGERLPETIFDNEGLEKSGEMMALTTGSMSNPELEKQWDGLGLLIGDGYKFLDNSRCLYCPCHRGTHNHSQLVGDAKSSPVRLYSNYHFRGDTDIATQQHRFLFLQSSDNCLVADGMREESDINHKTGTNTLRGDISVRFWSDNSKLLRNTMQSHSVDDPATEENYEKLWTNFNK
ncbi:MAG: type II secretion system protein [Planctomycetota bacterium]|nr:type II secretion system protein [Planctomycetota bacterium]